MSAKHSRKGARREASPAREVTPQPAATPLTATPSASGAATAEPAGSWIDSTEPRKRTIGRIVLVAVWIYVAALWLLVLDQTFHWGIFGPKVPPVP